MEELTKEEIQAYKKAGEIASKVKKYAKSKIKQGDKLADIAELIEAHILELGGEIAFPVNLSIDDIAAHYTPTLNDETLAEGLLKIDLGVHIEGFIADTAFTLDLTKDNQHRKLIKATEQALENAQKITNQDVTLTEIGQAIHDAITKEGFSPINNLSGHSLDQYEIHAGITIPNYPNNNNNFLGKGAFAIEPFATTGAGIIYEGGESNIYHIIKEGMPRDRFAREILKYIEENKQALPFSSRELEREFGPKVRLALRRLIEAGIITHYPQLIEKTHKPVAQTENTIIIYDDKVEITSE